MASRFSLAAKLYSIFALFAVLVAAITALSDYNTRQNAELTEAVSIASRAALNVERINSLVYAVVMESRGIYMSSEPAVVKKYGDGLLKFNARILEVVKNWEALVQADWRLGQRAIPSPAAGLVHDTYYVVGDWVPAGSPVAAVLPPANVRVRFFVPETVLGNVRAGQSVQVACDGCGAPLAAQITFVSDRAEYTPPVLYTRELRAKLVYLVEARPMPADAHKLHPGQPVEVTLAAAGGS